MGARVSPLVIGAWAAAAAVCVACLACATEREASTAPSPVHHVDVDGAAVTVVIAGAPADAAALLGWVKHSADIVHDYCGGFPVPDIEITLHVTAGDDVFYGEHQDGRFIEVWVGHDVTARSLAKDWVLVHEMLHAAMPDLPEGHRWMQEGLSTFAEPIARAQAGELTPAQVWASWLEMMPKGRPGFYDGGLDKTHTWGRTYWGGALYWLAADVEIRRQTGNQKSVRDAVRGLLRAGGNGRVEWAPRKVATVGDDATGTIVLRTLYARLADAPGDVDLDVLFRQLGVQASDDGRVTFDDTAPLADVRRAMTAR